MVKTKFSLSILYSSIRILAALSCILLEADWRRSVNTMGCSKNLPLRLCHKTKALFLFHFFCGIVATIFLSWCGVGSTFHVLKKSTWSILRTLIRSSHVDMHPCTPFCHHFFTFYFHFKTSFFASAVLLVVRLFRVMSCDWEKKEYVISSRNGMHGTDADPIQQLQKLPDPGDKWFRLLVIIHSVNIFFIKLTIELVLQYVSFLKYSEECISVPACIASFHKSK